MAGSSIKVKMVPKDKSELPSAAAGHYYTAQRNSRAEKLSKKMFNPVIRQHILYVEDKIK